MPRSFRPQRPTRSQPDPIQPFINPTHPKSDQPNPRLTDRHFFSSRNDSGTWRFSMKRWDNFPLSFIGETPTVELFLFSSRISLYSIFIYCILLYSISLYSIFLYSIFLNSIFLNSIFLYYISLYSIFLYLIILILSHYISLYLP